MAWYIPLLIFLARICDVSIGTFRTMLVISGHKFLAAGLGFVEVIIWLLAVGGTLQYIQESFLTLIGYAGGFAVGVLVGMWLEEKIALGYRAVRIISSQSDQEISYSLRELGYGVTKLQGHGREGTVEIAFVVIKRRKLAHLRTVVQEIDPNAFMTVERIDTYSGAIVATDSRFGKRFMERATAIRK